MRNIFFGKTFYQYAAFTLAEVLITLGIIGIVAQTVLPTLYFEVRDIEIVTRLKKIYSNLSSATTLITIEKGPISTWNWEPALSTMDEVIEDYKTHLKFAKTCPYGDVTYCYYESGWRMLNGNSYFTNFPGGAGYYTILNDGAYIKFVKCNVACTYFVPTNYNPHFYVIVNVNGDKPPNRMGRDIFIFVLTEKKGLIPPVINLDTMCDNAGATGATCANRVISESAINY